MRPLALIFLIVGSAMLLVWAWNDVVLLGPSPSDSLNPSTLYAKLELPILLVSVLLLQLAFAWVSRPPSMLAVPATPQKRSGDAWERVWVRILVSSCWTLILAIFLFMLHVFVGGA